MGEATLKLMEVKLGRDHPDTRKARINLANAYSRAGRTAEAIALLNIALKDSESIRGHDHPFTLVARNSLAQAELAAGGARPMRSSCKRRRSRRRQRWARSPGNARQPRQPRRSLPRRRPDR